MIRTILLDLDDTLLANSMDTFLPAYFQGLGAHLSDLVDKKRMLNELVAGTQDMLTNLDPCTTLEQAFANHFYPALGLPEAETRTTIEAFYNGAYKDLKSLTSRVPGATTLVENLRTRGLELVVATNPLFPRMAIDERLRWAGIMPGDGQFALVTSYESLHFAKPQPEYYAEILARLGRYPGEALMIGDNLEADIKPAHRLGMAVYHVTNEPDPEFPSGDLQSFPMDLLSTRYNPGSDPLEDPRIILARLRALPAAVRAITAGMDPSAWTRRPEANEWAPTEIICHLRDVEQEVNLPRLAAILELDSPHLPAFDTDRWAEERDYISMNGPSAQDEFCMARLRLLAALAKLRPEEWERTGRHSLLGPTTLRELFKFSTEHDWLHIAQLRKTLASLESLPPKLIPHPR